MTGPGHLASFSFSVPNSGNVKNGDQIIISKIPMPTTTGPTPPAAPTVMGTITVSGIPGSGVLNGPFAANIYPGEVRNLVIGNPPTAVTFTWTIGPAGNTFLRDEYITLYSTYNANGQFFFLNFQQ